MSRIRSSQGVISGEFSFNGVEFVEIFDRDFKYMFGEIDDVFVAHGTWVEYDVVEAPRNHPKNCKYFARNVKYVDVKKSKAPTSDEFRSNDMNVRDYNKVDFFQYDNSEGILTHKSTIRRDPYRNGQYYNEYYGEVIVSGDAYRRLIEHRIDELDVMMNLIPSKNYTSGPYWDVIHFINQGKQYSINGYLSITGHVLRGPGGVVRNRSEVTVAPDSLRPRAASMNTFGNAPTGRSGLGGRTRMSGFGLGATAAANGFGFGQSFGNDDFGNSSMNMSRNNNNNNNSNHKGYVDVNSTWESTTSRNETDPFENFGKNNVTIGSQRIKLDPKRGFETTGEWRNGIEDEGFKGDGRGFGRPSVGLGRLSNARF